MNENNKYVAMLSIWSIMDIHFPPHMATYFRLIVTDVQLTATHVLWSHLLEKCHTLPALFALSMPLRVFDPIVFTQIISCFLFCICLKVYKFVKIDYKAFVCQWSAI